MPNEKSVDAPETPPLELLVPFPKRGVLFYRLARQDTRRPRWQVTAKRRKTMAWIKSYQELGRHPKTKRLARLLKVSTAQTIGHLHLFWWWCLDYAPDGSMAIYEADEIADAAQWEGDPETFLNALIKSGFVDNGNPPTVHDWNEYGGTFIKCRAQAAKRAKKHRDKLANHGTVTRDVCVTNAHGTHTEKTREDTYQNASQNARAFVAGTLNGGYESGGIPPDEYPVALDAASRQMQAEKWGGKHAPADFKRGSK